MSGISIDMESESLKILPDPYLVMQQLEQVKSHWEQIVKGSKIFVNSSNLLDTQRLIQTVKEAFKTFPADSPLLKELILPEQRVQLFGDITQCYW